MSESIVSVIIPVLNVENYVEKCLKSVINQTYKELEIIIILNKGTDNTCNVVKSFCDEVNDKRIKLIETNTDLDVSSSRNLGIKKATGDYVYFIDSDDFIDSDYIESLVLSIKNSNSDMVCNLNMLKYYSENDIKNKQVKKQNIKDLYANKIVDCNNEVDSFIPTSLLCKLYKRSTIIDNNLLLPEGLIFEDYYFWNVLKTKIKKIYFIDKPTYYYVQRENSLFHSYKFKGDKTSDSIEIIKLIFLYYKENNLLDKYPIHFKWIKKFFKKVKDKKEFFEKVKELFLYFRDKIVLDKTIYSKEDLKIFSAILSSKSYLQFRIKTLF